MLAGGRLAAIQDGCQIADRQRPRAESADNLGARGLADHFTYGLQQCGSGRIQKGIPRGANPWRGHARTRLLYGHMNPTNASSVPPGYEIAIDVTGGRP